MLNKLIFRTNPKVLTATGLFLTLSSLFLINNLEISITISS
jgi:hypothetical protein